MQQQHKQPNPHLSGAIHLPVLPGDKTTVRPSKMSKWRALSLILVHVTMIVHAIQWLITGKTISPIEPSEAMYTLNDGHLNAGFIFFAVAILATLIFGRYLCGWGCHLIAYQDIAAWLLKKIRIKPKPFRSRILILAPLALAIYMFVWPTAYRLYIGAPAPATQNHLITTDYWKTFPTYSIAILTVIICGFGIVYFLGSKGFCTYACPYGGFFAVADKVAPGRIRVSDACEHCGHCTAACTSNVRVHEEVATYGMVVDPGCMKCMDCVSVCPNDALSFGFGIPSIAKTQTQPPKPRKYDFTLTEELAMTFVGIAAILSYRGLYNQVPLLLAMGMAAITAFLLMKAWRLVVSTNVRFQNLKLKTGNRITTPGALYALSSLVLIAFFAHSGFIQYTFAKAHARSQAIQLPDAIWSPRDNWWESAPDQAKQEVTDTITALETVNRLGLTKTPAAMSDLVRLYLASGNVEAAESTVRELIKIGLNESDCRRGLAGVLRKQERFDEAEESYRKALEVDPSFSSARIELAKMLVSQNRTDDAINILREGSSTTRDKKILPPHVSKILSDLARFDEARAELAPLLKEYPNDPDLLIAMGFIETRAGNAAAGINYWQRALKIDPGPTRANVRYNLAMALLGQNQIEEAITHLQHLVDNHPDFLQARYNLAVALYMTGKIKEALPHAQKAQTLSPNDRQIRAFAQMLQAKETIPQTNP